MREALNLALDQAMERDDRVLLLGEDIADPGASGPTKGLSTKYGDDRVLDTPISEAAIVGAAIGLAMEGFRPVAEIMIMDFIGIAADQIVNHAAKMRFMTGGRTTAPITVRTQVYGGLGTGGTHSQSLEGWFMHIPGLKVVVPSSPRDGKGLMTSAIFDDDPCIFVETIRLQGQRGPVPVDPGFSIPLGQADIKRPGSDVTLIAYGRGVVESIAAAAELADDGIDAEVLDLRTLVPLDVPGDGRVGGPHAAGRRRARRGAVRGPGRRDRRHAPARAVRRAGRADRAGRRALRAEPGAGRPRVADLPERRAHRRRRGAHARVGPDVRRHAMADFTVHIPRLSVAISEATLIDVLVADGEHVERGRPAVPRRDREGRDRGARRRVGHRPLDRRDRHDL